MLRNVKRTLTCYTASQFSMVALLIREKIYVNEVVSGTGFGILMGPHVADVFDPHSWNVENNAVTLEVMRVVLATGLFAIGVELPHSYMWKHINNLLIMVVPTMAFGWLVFTGLMHILFPGLKYTSALAISACLTPTDPVVSAAIIGGQFAIEHVPGNLRRLIVAESASNDGLAYPFLSISLYLTTESYRHAFRDWFLVGWLYQVILGIVIGIIIGRIFYHLMRYTDTKGFIDRESYVVQYLALAIFTVGVTSTIGCDDLLAAFQPRSFDQIENEVFSSVIDLILNCVAFIYIGAWIPFDQFNQAELGITPWRLVVLSLIILTLRRIPFLLMLYKVVPEIANWRQALFAGHFGPIGVGAVFVSTLATTRLERIQDPSQNQQFLTAALHPIVAFIVLCSIVVHGLSIPLFSAVRQIHHLAVKKRTDTPEIFFWNRHSPVTPAHSCTDIELGGRGSRTVISASDGTGVETVGPESTEVGMSLGEAEVSEHPGLAHSRMMRRVLPGFFYTDGVHHTTAVTAGPRDHERRDSIMLEGDVADERVYL